MKGVDTNRKLMKNLVEKINSLSPNSQLKVEELVNLLLATEQQTRTKKKLRQDWAGALSMYRDQYTSLELQRETVEQWTQ